MRTKVDGLGQKDCIKVKFRKKIIHISILFTGTTLPTAMNGSRSPRMVNGDFDDFDDRYRNVSFAILSLRMLLLWKQITRILIAYRRRCAVDKS